MSRVEEEKIRILRVAEEQLKRIELESDMENGLSVEESEEKVKTGKGASRTNKDRSSRHKQSGAYATRAIWDSFSSESSESDEESKRKRQKRQVKSGSKVKKRLVKRTELWPHTIALEDDGEEVSCDDIGFAKFLSCFTYIMSTCERKTG